MGSMCQLSCASKSSTKHIVFIVTTVVKVYFTTVMMSIMSTCKACMQNSIIIVSMLCYCRWSFSTTKSGQMNYEKLSLMMIMSICKACLQSSVIFMSVLCYCR